MNSISGSSSSPVLHITSSFSPCQKSGGMLRAGKQPAGPEKTISLQDVAETNVVMMKEGSFLRQTILAKMKAANVAPNIVLESNQVVTLKGLVASGVGVAFLLDMVVEDTPGIKAIPLADPIFVDVGLAWKKIATSQKQRNLSSTSAKIY